MTALQKPIAIAVDFDGTCVTHEFPKVGRDIGAQRVLKRLVDAGHKLILFTMRSDKEDNTGFSDEVPEVHNGKYLTDAVNWFLENGIELWGIQTNPVQLTWTTSPKAYAQLYIDEAALGCPLITPKNERPYANWGGIEQWLENTGILPRTGSTMCEPERPETSRI